MQEKPLHYITRLVTTATNENIHYIQYYRRLLTTYGSANTCESVMKTAFNLEWKNKIQTHFNDDVDSRLGTYMRVNPNLLKYENLLDIWCSKGR